MATLATLALGGALAGCGDAPSELAPVLLASPETLEVSDTATQPARIFLTTQPAGTLEWQVTGVPPWARVEPMQGTVDRGLVEIRVHPQNTGELALGSYQGRIEVLASGSKATVAAQLVVHGTAAVAVSASSLSLSDTASFAHLIVSNRGRGVLRWSMTSSEPWLTLSPSSGELLGESGMLITVVPNRAGLPPGTATATLTVASNATNGTLTVPVGVEVASRPAIDVSPGWLDFPDGVEQREVRISNIGNAPLNWSASGSQPWLTATPASGQTAPGASAAVVVRVNRTGLRSGVHSATLTVASDAGAARTIEVEATVASRAQLSIRSLNFRVLDAEFSTSANRLVAVSSSPARLNIVDPDVHTVQHVDLPLTPTAVSVSPDGRFAAVGHNGFISYVNLESRSIVRTYPVTTDVLDLVLAGNGFVYAFPRRDQWERIRCIDLDTGVETLHTGLSIYAGTVARLHPSGDFLYAANNGLSPSNFEKFDIRSGTASYMYRSPYHGDFEFAGNVWISENGALLFARSGNVFRSSPVQAEDMRYAGKFEGVNGIRWAVHSQARQRIYLLPDALYPHPPARPEVRVYNDGFLALEGSALLPKFRVTPSTGSTMEHDAHGRFAFVNQTGTRLYVVVQADESSGLAQDWAIVVYDATELP